MQDRFFSSNTGAQQNQTLYDMYLIDFDQTISAGHTHKGIKNQIRSNQLSNDANAIYNYIKANPMYDPIGGANNWKLIMEAIVKNQCHLAVVSFNAYPDMIKKYLSDKIGLSSDIVSKIHINSWLPENPQSASKQEHIDKSIDHFKYQGSAERILLVDDDEYNTSQAKLSGYAVLSANKTGEHVSQLKRNLQIIDLDLKNDCSASTIKNW